MLDMRDYGGWKQKDVKKAAFYHGKRSSKAKKGGCNMQPFFICLLAIIFFLEYNRIVK